MVKFKVFVMQVARQYREKVRLSIFAGMTVETGELPGRRVVFHAGNLSPEAKRWPELRPCFSLYKDGRYFLLTKDGPANIVELSEYSFTIVFFVLSANTKE
jgi:hypothetical protein